MSNYNFFERKLRILESFYMWIEQGNTYDVAVEQCRYYNYPKNDLDEILIPITIATRFSRSGKKLPLDFIDHLNNIIEKYQGLDLNEFQLSDEELLVMKEEVDEVKSYIAK